MDVTCSWKYGSCACVLNDLYQIVLVFILVYSMRHEASYRCMYTHRLFVMES